MSKPLAFLFVMLFALNNTWGSAQNQADGLPIFPTPTLVVGGQINYLGFILGTGLHLGAEDLFIDNLGLRLDTEVFIPNKDNQVIFGLTFLYTAYEQDALSFYTGAGLRASTYDSYGSFGVGLLGGIEYHFFPFSWFAEAEYSTMYPIFRTGLNYRFKFPENP